MCRSPAEQGDQRQDHRLDAGDQRQDGNLRTQVGRRRQADRLFPTVDRPLLDDLVNGVGRPHQAGADDEHQQHRGCVQVRLAGYHTQIVAGADTPRYQTEQDREGDDESQVGAVGCGHRQRAAKQR